MDSENQVTLRSWPPIILHGGWPERTRKSAATKIEMSIEDGGGGGGGDWWWSGVPLLRFEAMREERRDFGLGEVREWGLLYADISRGLEAGPTILTRQSYVDRRWASHRRICASWVGRPLELCDVMTLLATPAKKVAARAFLL